MDISRVGYNEIPTANQKLTGSSQLLSNVKIGDILNGTLNKLPNGQIVLLSETGEALPVQLNSHVIFNEAVALKVLQKQEGQILLQPIVENIGDQTLQNKIMQELNLPVSGQMKELIGYFLAKQVPVQRENLLKSYHMVEHFDIPGETLANLSAQNQPLTLKEAEQLHVLKQTRLHEVLGNLEQLITDTKSPEIVKNIYHVLEKFLDADSLQEAFKGLIKDGETTRKSNTLPNTHEHIQNRQLRDESTQMMAHVSKFMPKQWKIFAHTTRELLHKALTMDINTLKTHPKVAKAHFEIQQKVLQTLTEALEDTPLTEKGTQVLKQLEDVSHIVSKLNVEGSYYFFPLNLNKGEGTGELYFFKPKKKKQEEKNHLYVVLALDLPTLNKIEIHMRQEDQKVNLHFKLKNQQMINLFTKYISVLNKNTRQASLHLDEINFSLLELEKKHSIMEKDSHKLSRMDFKI